MEILSTRTFATSAGGNPSPYVSGRDLPRTPPPPIAALTTAELADAWLVATGVNDGLGRGASSELEPRLAADEDDPEGALGRAWVAATTPVFLS